MITAKEAREGTYNNLPDCDFYIKQIEVEIQSSAQAGYFGTSLNKDDYPKNLWGKILSILKDNGYEIDSLNSTIIVRW